MTTKSSIERTRADHNERVAGEAKNVRLEPVSLRVRTAVKAGFTRKVDKPSPML